MGNRRENSVTCVRLSFGGSKTTEDGDCSHERERRLLLGRKPMTHLDSVLKGRDIALPTKVHKSKLSFPNSHHVCMGELDHKESWALKNWWFWTVVLGKTLESPLDCKEINAVNARGNQSSISIGRTNAEAPILWPSEAKTGSFEKTLMQGKIEGQRRRGRQRMRWLDGITILMGLNFKQALGVGDGQWSLMCCRQ